MYLSIITVSYNNLQGLEKTQKSLEKLIGDKVEWIVIDGHFNDQTKKYLQKLHLSGFRFISEQDSGIFDAMNKGIDMALGEYFLFLNAGDCLLINSIEKLPTSQFHDVNVFNIQPVGEKGDSIPWKGLKTDPSQLKHHNIIPHQSTLIHRRCFEFKRYTQHLRFGGDYDLFCFLYCHGYRFEFFPEIKLSQFGYDGASSSLSNSYLLLKEKRRIQTYYFGKTSKKYEAVYLVRFILSWIPFGNQIGRMLRGLIFKEK